MLGERTEPGPSPRRPGFRANGEEDRGPKGQPRESVGLEHPCSFGDFGSSLKTRRATLSSEPSIITFFFTPLRDTVSLSPFRSFLCSFCLLSFFIYNFHDYLLK